MANTPEGKITDAIRKALKKMAPDVWFFKIHGGPLQKAGVPDFLVVVRGVAVFLEVKQPKGKISRLQRYVKGQIRKAGGVAEVVYSDIEAQEVIEYVKRYVDEGGRGAPRRRWKPSPSCEGTRDLPR